MKIHKYTRSLKRSNQFILCSGKRADFAENVTYFWKKVTCKECLKLSGKK